MDPIVTLVCFAVKEEAAPFLAWSRTQPSVEVLVTGMGRRNAGQKFSESLVRHRPQFAVTAGFAGGLNPNLKPGEVLYDGDIVAPNLKTTLQDMGARAGIFLCADRVAVTAAEKKLLFETTQADAIEMESAAIRELCRAEQIPAATMRVILDPAGEDLPLDFNQLMTSDMRIDPLKLGLQLARSPLVIPKLLRFQKQARAAAESLGRVLQTTVQHLANGLLTH